MPTTAPTSTELAQFCARYLAAWNGRDATAMADLVTDDAVWVDPALPARPPGFAPTGRAIDIAGVDLWAMRDGRIARSRAFYDFNALAVQLGLAPAPGSRMEKGAVALQRLQARVTSRRSA